jgi:hypothetical protein
MMIKSPFICIISKHKFRDLTFANIEQYERDYSEESEREEK